MCDCIIPVGGRHPRLDVWPEFQWALRAFFMSSTVGRREGEGADQQRTRTLLYPQTYVNNSVHCTSPSISAFPELIGNWWRYDNNNDNPEEWRGVGMKWKIEICSTENWSESLTCTSYTRLAINCLWGPSIGSSGNWREDELGEVTHGRGLSRGYGEVREWLG